MAKGIFKAVMTYVSGTVIEQCRQLINKQPTLTMKEAKKIVTAKVYHRISSGKAHYGAQASARNLRHAQNRTHGLCIKNNAINFA
jgi:hypothetical protein